MGSIGVLGGRWRASVSESGSILSSDSVDGTRLDWFVAADDRWHIPSSEAAVRQRRIHGAPVFETRLRVPTGDAVHRVWCVADGGGYTVVEIENDSTLPFAVAFNSSELLSARPPSDVPIEGISLPAGSVVFPVGHHSTIRVAVAHSTRARGVSTAQLLDGLASAEQVARGWTSVLDRAGRMELPDESVVADVARLRAEVALNGPVDESADPTGFLIDVGQLVRQGERAEPWVPELVNAVSAVARLHHSWDAAAALDAAALILATAGEARAVRDVARMRRPEETSLPQDASAIDGESRLRAWHELRLARCVGAGVAELMAGGIPSSWHGVNFEVHDLSIGPSSTVSYAVRWHGERPAVLWQIDGAPIRLTASAIAPGWTSTLLKGEALWPAPVSAMAAPVPNLDDISFS